MNVINNQKKTPQLSGSSIEEKRAELKDYFRNTWATYESLFSLINHDEAYYLRPEPLRHPLIFYFGHTATFYINKLILGKYITQRVNKKIEASEKLIRLTYQAWLQSREMKHAQKTLELLFSRFKQPKDGIELLRHTMDAEQWSASLSISENLNKLDLIPKQKGQVLLFEGIANYKLGNQRQAILFLSKAMGIETSKSQAKGWLNYVKQ